MVDSVAAHGQDPSRLRWDVAGSDVARLRISRFDFFDAAV
jgi:hypothetical protein